MAAIERKIIHIDEDKCNGCGECVSSCAEGAIQIVNGKAKLVSETYCDGLGACLGPCPTGALSIVTRKAEEFDQQAAEHHVERLKAGKAEPKAAPKPEQKPATLGCGCQGSMARALKPAAGHSAPPPTQEAPASTESALMNWPVQLMLIPPKAAYLKDADLLLAADCVAFADGGFHRRMMSGKPVAIACPKLDDPEPRIAKLAEMITTANLKSITVARMEVPCCGGLTAIAKEAIRRSGRDIPLRTAILGVDGAIKQLM